MKVETHKLFGCVLFKENALWKSALSTNSSCSSLPPAPLWPGAAGKRFAHGKGYLIPQDVIARAGQFMRHGLERPDPIGLCLLALGKASDPVILLREVDHSI